jgi:glutathione synthase/RimK-type ligase-like ATP-grasp enzyme
MCKRIAAMFHHTLAGIDLKKTRDGYVVIESNSMPVYLDIELKTQAPITNAIVETLLSARTALR